MRVLFISLPNIGLIGGGGLPKQINITANALIKTGVDIIYYDPWVNQIKDVDLCHFFGPCSGVYSVFEKALINNKSVVFSPVFNFNYDGITWKQRKIMASLSNIPGVFTSYKLIKRMLKDAHKVLPLNDEEQNMLAKIFNVQTKNFSIVPIGLNKIFASGDPKLFQKEYGLSDFVLNVSTMIPTKNQLSLIKAMNDLPYPLVLIGPMLEQHKDYAEKCKKVAGKNVLFAGRVNEDMLVSAYAAAKVFVLPSFSEVMPSCLYEAAMAGCKLITSTPVPVAPEIRKQVRSADPNKPEDFRALIQQAMESTSDNELRNIVLSMPSWEEVAVKIKTVYKELLSA